MLQCERCKEEFQYPSQLIRHMNKKIPCEELFLETTPMFECSFCKKPWNTLKQQHRHESRCNFKDDYVRHLERQMCAIPAYAYNPAMCRFCTKEMCPKHVVRHEKSCKMKAEHQKELEAQRIAKTESGTHNINIYNITQTNNNT